jgi:putative transposase
MSCTYTTIVVQKIEIIDNQRDDNAAVNLARYEETASVVGPVGAAVKRGADRKTRPGRAGGCEAWKGRSRKAAEQPRDGVQVALSLKITHLQRFPRRCGACAIGGA